MYVGEPCGDIDSKIWKHSSHEDVKHEAISLW